MDKTQFYVYILHSDKFDKYYIGQTNDMERRLFEHNNKATNSFTAKYRPWRLAMSLEVERVERFLLENLLASVIKANWI